MARSSGSRVLAPEAAGIPLFAGAAGETQTTELSSGQTVMGLPLLREMNPRS